MMRAIFLEPYHKRQLLWLINSFFLVLISLRILEIKSLSWQRSLLAVIIKHENGFRRQDCLINFDVILDKTLSYGSIDSLFYTPLLMNDTRFDRFIYKLEEILIILRISFYLIFLNWIIELFHSSCILENSRFCWLIIFARFVSPDYLMFVSILEQSFE